MAIKYVLLWFCGIRLWHLTHKAQNVLITPMKHLLASPCLAGRISTLGVNQGQDHLCSGEQALLLYGVPHAQGILFISFTLIFTQSPQSHLASLCISWFNTFLPDPWHHRSFLGANVLPELFIPNFPEPRTEHHIGDTHKILINERGRKHSGSRLLPKCFLLSLVLLFPTTHWGRHLASCRNPAILYCTPRKNSQF